MSPRFPSKTQVLTPVNDAKIKAQIIQRISEGEIRFDIDSGRLLSKQLDINEVVLGFNGAQSRMKYLARLTETAIDTDSPKESKTGGPLAAKSSDSETK